MADRDAVFFTVSNVYTSLCMRLGDAVFKLALVANADF